jgi:hypothetical protein
MGCGCKKDSNNGLTLSDSVSEKNKNQKIVEYIPRTFLFIFSLIIVPLIIPAVIWLLFKTIVLSDSIDVLPALKILGLKLKKMTNSEDDDEDDEDEDEVGEEEELNEENYELIDVDNWEPIKVTNKKD